ncbi:unnamed protein product [Adineta steineri]|uniref:UDP-N-acetylglucosamine--peptide N-acetylglucosaminyltransferase SPINDLY n=1 Tax=Adineta steineri TaxID=433720 RepID=A0A813ZK54_9BILA|nr:unnamed protein product [Adineta steineri]CAF1001306.1 unnamed protein product [Adineta steineri]
MHRIENVLVVWLDGSIDPVCGDCQETITQLRHIVNNIHTYTDSDQCVDFIQTVTDNKICVIISGALGQHVVPCVHGMSQVDSIFIFCSNQKWHEQWAKSWRKIKGVYTQLPVMCEAIKYAVKQCEQSTISLSFIPKDIGDVSTITIDRLDPSFLYTQILKEILLSINFEEKHVKKFANYCRDIFGDNPHELDNIAKLEQKYFDNTPIWWYTYDCFLYPMLNRILRLMDVDIIFHTSFFIVDLHRDIQRLHLKQYFGHDYNKTFMVYRGQGMSKKDFEQISNTKDGLMSFNNFLFTNKNPQVCLRFADEATKNPDLVPVLFVMTIDPTQSTVPFASISETSFHRTKDEVLFSIRSVFRINDIKPMNENNLIHEIHLTLIGDNDKDLRALNNRIREETFPEEEGWYRLGVVLIKMGQYDKAEGFYEFLLGQTTHENDKAFIYHELGRIKYNLKDYQKALINYEKSLEIKQKNLPPNHADFANLYNNIGLVYKHEGNYSEALSSHKKAVEIQKLALSSQHLDLSTSYSNIGNVYDSMGNYLKALSYHEKALKIRQKALPPNHPTLAYSYNNMGLTYDNMGYYSQALSSHEKALAIRQEALPPNHPDLASSYNNIGNAYDNLGDHAKALKAYEKSLELIQESLPPNHPDLGRSYYNIGLVYQNMGNFLKAYAFYDRAVEIGQESLPPEHPHLQLYKKNFENMKQKFH